MLEPDDLLTAPVFSLRVGHQTVSASLPEVLAHLSGEQPVEPLALQPHQHHAWHAFLVQVAALARHRSGRPEGLTSPEPWRAALLALSGGVAEAWRLTVSDLSKPAFQQPPIPEGSLDRKRWSELTTPDALDILVTAKNHDVKQTRIRHGRVEHWVFALINLQTMQGFLGAGNYGIARMNGGFGNRPSLAASPSLRWNDRFRRDVGVWLGQRERLLESHGYRGDGVGLVWLEAWDGTGSMPSTRLDPFFIETCRRVRFTAEPDGPRAWMLPTKAARLKFEAGGGNTGDIWTPIERKRNVALSLAGGGFDYGKLTELLFEGDWEKPAALRGDEKAVTQLQAWALVRGQGKTEGLHEATLTLGQETRRLFAKGDPEQRLADRAKHRVQDAATVRLRVLRPALLALVQGGPDSLDFQDKRVDALTSRFDDDVNDAFFSALFESFESPSDDDPNGTTRWRRFLWERAQHHFDAARGALPFPSERRWKAIARGETALKGAAWKHIPEVFEKTQDPTDPQGETDVEHPTP